MASVDLPTGLSHLERALELSAGRVDPEAEESARGVLDVADARARVGIGRTVVALAGATGSGKSSLLNALVGQHVARTAVRRPTTGAALAVSGRHAADLLDWLGVRERKVLLQLDAAPWRDVVLIDLPDLDSTESTHREEASRIISRADVLVWVLDPQKYADAVVHEDYLRHLTQQSASMIIVLNQVDRLNESERRDVLEDLARQAAADGITSELVAVSAATTENLGALQAAISKVAGTRQAAAERLAGSVRGAGAALLQATGAAGGTAPRPTVEDFTPVAGLLASAAGADTVARAAGASYERRALKATGWPVVRWFRTRGADPLERLHLVHRDDTSETGALNRVTSPARWAAARAALAAYTDRACAALARRWRASVRGTAGTDADALGDEAEQIIARADTEYRRRPAWWGALNTCQWIGTAALAAGLVWYLLVWIGGALGIRLGEPPYWGVLPIPAVLLLGGAMWCAVCSAIARPARQVGRRRVEQRVSARLKQEISARAESSVLAPLRAEAGAYTEFYAAVETLRRVAA